MKYDREEIIKWLLELGAIDSVEVELNSIKRLDLSHKGIDSIPKSIVLLESLIGLSLANNNLTTLPENLGELQNLVNLDVRRNSFESVPVGMTHLQLRALNLSSNKIVTLDTLEKMTTLQVLDLSANKIVNIEHTFRNMQKLRSLNLSFNHISTLDSMCMGLNALEILQLSHNNLTVIPDRIKQLKALIRLDLSFNYIDQIHANFFTLEIEDLDLSSNRIKRLNLSGLSELEKITIDENLLESFSIEEDFAPNLRYFSAESCRIGAFVALPNTELEYISYASNEITTLPDTIHHYGKLKELDIDHNFIQTLPVKFLELDKLTTLYIDGNPLDMASRELLVRMDLEVCDIHVNEEVQIRKAQFNDLQVMAELLHQLFEVEKDFSVDLKKQMQGLVKLFNDQAAQLLVAKYRNRVIGMITMQSHISTAEGSVVGIVEDLIVDNEFRKMGVGSRLLEAIRLEAMKKKYTRISLACDKNNTVAQHFYEERGFTKTNLFLYHYKD